MTLMEKLKPMYEENKRLITTDRKLQTYMASVFVLLFSIIIYNEYFGDFQNAEECFHLADRMISGDFDYGSLGTNYSPLTLLLLIPPRLFAPNAEIYCILFSMYGFAFYMLGGHFMLKSCRETGFPEKDAYILLFLFFICSLSFMTLSTGPIAAAFVIMSLWFFYIKNYTISLSALALASMTGFYPILLLLVYLVLLISDKRLKEAFKGIITYVAICALLLVFPVGAFDGSIAYVDIPDSAGIEIVASFLIASALILLIHFLMKTEQCGISKAATMLEMGLIVLVIFSPVYSEMYYIWIAMLFPMTQMKSGCPKYRPCTYICLTAYSIMTLLCDTILNHDTQMFDYADSLRYIALALFMFALILETLFWREKKTPIPVSE